jgi:hypothetical protein
MANSRADPSGNTAPAPTIQSDKADYAPGATVNLTGSNWQPGESVHIYVNDDEGQTWSRNVDVTADQSGNITDQFSLPDWFVATYSVVATGQASGEARTTFTDSPLAFTPDPRTVPVAAGSSANFTQSVSNGNSTANVTGFSLAGGNTGCAPNSVPAVQQSWLSFVSLTPPFTIPANANGVPVQMKITVPSGPRLDSTLAAFSIAAQMSAVAVSDSVSWSQHQ